MTESKMPLRTGPQLVEDMKLVLDRQSPNAIYFALMCWLVKISADTNLFPPENVPDDFKWFYEGIANDQWSTRN